VGTHLISYAIAYPVLYIYKRLWTKG